MILGTKDRHDHSFKGKEVKNRADLQRRKDRAVVLQIRIYGLDWGAAAEKEKRVPTSERSKRF